MCGIAGVCHREPGAKADADLLERMCWSIRHRGPDDQGVLVDGRIAMGMRRLAVIDLETGQQPIDNEDGSVTVVFNGEIYNFRELRSQLTTAGHKFRTTSDTEVLVHLYEEYGDQYAEQLRGMFAIALWDHRQQRLLLTRDRLGVKPLFYRVEADRLLFGSEIKAILQDREVARKVDFVALDQMLRWGYVVPPRTCFEGIQELEPASQLVYENGTTKIERYWDLTQQPTQDWDERAALAELRSRLEDCIRMRLISDVPLGALLSGGLDSTIIVALMSELSSKPVKTFSVGFDDSAFSELPLAAQVAERYGTDHHPFVVKPDVVEVLPELVQHHDTPFYDSSALPTFYVCKMARSEVTVALSGDGGDELFAGYNIYIAMLAAERYARLPRWLRRGLIEPVARLIPETSGYLNLGRVAREFVRAGATSRVERYRRWASKMKDETRQEMYRHPELVKLLDHQTRDHLDDLFAARDGDTLLSRMLYTDLRTELGQDVLVKVDRTSMANSLEVRSPLLDHTLHEFAARLPDQAKLRGRKTKYLLRRLAADLLPPELVRRPKRGFVVPLDRWFRESLGGYARGILLDETTRRRGLFDPVAMERLLDRHASGHRAYGRDIWNLITTELWHRQYIDGFEYAELPTPRNRQRSDTTRPRR